MKKSTHCLIILFISIGLNGHSALCMDNQKESNNKKDPKEKITKLLGNNEQEKSTHSSDVNKTMEETIEILHQISITDKETSELLDKISDALDKPQEKIKSNKNLGTAFKLGLITGLITQRGYPKLWHLGTLILFWPSKSHNKTTWLASYGGGALTGEAVRLLYCFIK